MYILLILTLIIAISGKLLLFPDFWHIEYFNELEKPDVAGLGMSDFAEDLWVVEVDRDELQGLRLKLGTRADEEKFERILDRVVGDYETQLEPTNSKITDQEPTKHSPDTERTGHEEPKYSTEPESSQIPSPEDFQYKNRNIKQAILRLVNKFTLSQSYQGSETNLSNLDDENVASSSIAVHFLGPYTSLVVKLDTKRWYYFIGPPSPFPRWFYVDHSTAINKSPTMDIEIPDDVANEYLETLLDLLETFLNIPL